MKSVTFKPKQYGDALRHSLFKMVDNPLELISFLYLRSRKVTDFAGKCELLIVDRLKATLNESEIQQCSHSR